MIFFHGWRRKAGCVTLVMACVLMAGWIRSQRIEDFVGGVVAFSIGEYRQVIATSPNQIAWWNWNEAETNGIAVIVNVSEFPPNPTPWDVQRAFAIETRAPHLIERRTVAYRALVLPLTFLSAYLLLFPSRKRTASKPDA